jgi:hypothetical protein
MRLHRTGLKKTKKYEKNSDRAVEMTEYGKSMRPGAHCSREAQQTRELRLRWLEKTQQRFGHVSGNHIFF